MNRQAALSAALTETTIWRKSSRSEEGPNCVETAFVSGWAGVRDSKLASNSPVLAVGGPAWRGFLRQIAAESTSR